MGTSTPSKRRLATIALIAGALTVLVPVAQAGSGFEGSPDAFDRAVAARQAETGFLGSPDAFDRAVAAKQAQKLSTIDARERSMQTRPALESVGTPPDAFERALQNRPTGRPSLLALQHFLANDARQRSLAAGSVGSVRTVSSTGFDWSDFGIGAGAGIGFILVTLGLGVGVLVMRHGHGRVTNP